LVAAAGREPQALGGTSGPSTEIRPLLPGSLRRRINLRLREHAIGDVDGSAETEGERDAVAGAAVQVDRLGAAAQHRARVVSVLLQAVDGDVDERGPKASDGFLEEVVRQRTGVRCPSSASEMEIDSDEPMKIGIARP